MNKSTARNNYDICKRVYSGILFRFCSYLIPPNKLKIKICKFVVVTATKIAVTLTVGGGEQDFRYRKCGC
jgi:hypothetical protein